MNEHNAVGEQSLRRKSESGQALVLAAIGLTVLMLAAGLAIDMGYLRYQKRRMQTAADSAAIAGATQLGGDFTDAAIDDAELNGFSASNGATITSTASTPCPDTTLNCVQVQVSQQQPLFFMRIVPNITAPTVSAIAMAEQKPGLGCIYALNNDPNAIEVGYSYHTIVAGPNCGIVDNGGLNVEENVPYAENHTVYASSIGVAGTWDGGGLMTPTPIQGIIPAGNPFGNLVAPPAPSPAICSGPASFSGNPSTVNIPAGAYPCGLLLDAGTSGNQIALSNGLYTIGGSGLTIQGEGGTVTGSGVTFYIDSVNGAGAVNINNNITCGCSDEAGPDFGATIHVEAPPDATSATSGAIPGVVLFQDPSDTSTASITLAGYQWSGSPADPSYPGSYLWGALYVPNATLALNGIGFDNPNPVVEKCSSVPRLTTVIANDLVFNKNLNFSTDDCQWPPVPVSTPIPSPNRNAVLVK